MTKKRKLLDGLNPDQIGAVTHREGPLLVLSGAGSGKTRVITHRIAYLIDYYDVDPDRILGLTFTNKAADEMKERLEKLLPSQLNGRSPWLGTFHALGVQFLRRHIDESGLDHDRFFTIYDGTDQEKAIKEIMVDLDISTEEFQPGMIASFINDAKNELIGPDEFRSERAGELDDNILRIVSRIYRNYQQSLEEWNALDFGDLIRLPTILLENDSTPIQSWRERFKFLLVDEYQDTNHSQYVMASQLAEPDDNICVVGDDDQAIFGWRGADVSNILEFEKDFPQAKVIHLSKNYRSKKPILRAANGIIRNNELRKPKEMEPDRGEGKALSVYNAPDEEAEADFLVRQIGKLRKKGARLGEIAILYRVNTLSRGIEKKLVEKSIPYEIVRGTRFYERKEIKDILAYLRVACNPSNDLHLLRIINSPRRGIGRKTQEEVRNCARDCESSIWAVLNRSEECPALSGRQLSRLMSFVELIKNIRERKNKQKPANFVKEMISDLEYFSWLEKEYDPESAEDRKNNIKELIGQLKEMDPGEGAIERFLENIALESDVDEFEDRKDKVSLLTLHSAKGLEFGYVFLIAMEDGLLPHQRSLEEQRLEEERRLCYVGLTRAKERVFMSYTDSRFLYGQRYSNIPSRFLHEIPDEELRRIDGNPGDIFAGSGNSKVANSQSKNWKDFLQ